MSNIERDLGVLEGRLGSMEGKLDRLIEGMDRHDDRLREVEKKTVLTSGVAAAIVSLGISLIGAKLKGLT
jgi:hypothetical protein